MDAEEPEFSGETKLDPEHIPLDDVEIYLEKLFAISAERPLDDRTLITLRKLGALLWQRYQLSRVECSDLQRALSEELLSNSERLRTLTALRRDEKKLQDRFQKNQWLLERVRERGKTHIRIAREAHELKRAIEEQKEAIKDLKKEIGRLKKKSDKQGHSATHHSKRN